MALFVINATDRAGALETRLATRDTHLAYLRDEGIVRAAGAFLDAAGNPEGSMLIVEAETIEAANAFAANDPYALAGVFASVVVRPWRMAIGAFA